LRFEEPVADLLETLLERGEFLARPGELLLDRRRPFGELPCTALLLGELGAQHLGSSAKAGVSTPTANAVARTTQSDRTSASTRRAGAGGSGHGHLDRFDADRARGR
jgi:hypothetical protein